MRHVALAIVGPCSDGRIAYEAAEAPPREYECEEWK